MLYVPKLYFYFKYNADRPCYFITKYVEKYISRQKFYTKNYKIIKVKKITTVF